LTNYKTFILYQNGKKVAEVSIIGEDLKPDKSKFKEFSQLLERFLSFSTPEIDSPEELARYLTKKARLLRDIVK